MTRVPCLLPLASCLVFCLIDYTVPLDYCHLPPGICLLLPDSRLSCHLSPDAAHLSPPCFSLSVSFSREELQTLLSAYIIFTCTSTLGAYYRFQIHRRTQPFIRISLCLISRPSHDSPIPLHYLFAICLLHLYFTSSMFSHHTSVSILVSDLLFSSVSSPLY
jgi:hypothetical protein